MNKPLYVLPLLIEQPTWGGEYIANFKSISDAEAAGKKIGQAYELFENSYVTSEFQEHLPYAFATATNVNEPTFFHKPEDLQTLQAVIDQDPEGILGKNALEKNGAKMKVLIKFTQAQNNSYQVHVKPGEEFDKWLAKPESWYYFEKGKATLGLKAGTSVEKYKTRCVEIDKKARELSERALEKKITVEEARGQLRDFINQDHPSRFVNTVFIEPNQVVDLSQGGTHHSWEMDSEISNGNIVYEVQVNVMDEFCTMRSFDQGNIKDDGKVRPLTIEHYFQAIDPTPEKNIPAEYLRTPQSSHDENAEVMSLFDNQFYKTTSLNFTGEYAGSETETKDTFHHLFTQEGDVEVRVSSQSFRLPKGWSLLVPASVGKYTLSSKEKSTVLKTSV